MRNARELAEATEPERETPMAPVAYAAPPAHRPTGPPAPGPRPRPDLWPALVLAGVGIVAAVTGIATTLPEPRLELSVSQPTIGYGDDDLSSVWIAQPGERYRVVQQDGEQVLAVSHRGGGPGGERTAWFARGPGVMVVAGRPEWLVLAGTWPDRLWDELGELLRKATDVGRQATGVL